MSATPTTTRAGSRNWPATLAILAALAAGFGLPGIIMLCACDGGPHLEVVYDPCCGGAGTMAGDGPSWSAPDGCFGCGDQLLEAPATLSARPGDNPSEHGSGTVCWSPPGFSDAHSTLSCPRPLDVDRDRAMGASGSPFQPLIC